MTEREYQREVIRDTDPTRREVYPEQAGAEYPATDHATREVVRERVSGPSGEHIVRRERVRTPSEATQRAATATRIQQAIVFIFGFIATMLAIRFVLLLLGANQASGFVQLVYGITQPFVAPFLGMFGEPAVGASVVEWASLVGIVVYSLIAYGLNRLVDLLYRPTHEERYDSTL
jgi:YggT family protein